MAVSALSDPSGGLIDLPLSFVLKNAMHLEAQDIAHFRLLAGVPLYLSFVFGLLRDRWVAAGQDDRKLISFFALVSTALYASFAFVPVSKLTYLIAILLLTSCSLFIASAQNGLSSELGQRHGMTGQISATWNIFTAIPSLIVFLAGGYLSQFLENESLIAANKTLFLLGALLALLLAGYTWIRPEVVFKSIGRKQEAATTPLVDLRRFLSHRPIYPALLIWMLWNFSPGSVTPLQYYLQNTLGAADWQWGAWNALFTASFIPTFLLHSWLCRRVPLSTILRWGTLAAVPQFVPLLFVDSIAVAMVIAVTAGLMGGLATAAYVDLIFRSAPRGLQGTMLMAASTVYFISTRLGDVLGSGLFDRFGGFYACVILTTIFYSLILFVLRLVSHDVVVGIDSPPAENAR